MNPAHRVAGSAIPKIVTAPVVLPRRGHPRAPGICRSCLCVCVCVLGGGGGWVCVGVGVGVGVCGCDVCVNMYRSGE